MGTSGLLMRRAPPIFARKGFIPVYVLRKSKGGCLTNIDNMMLWVLRYLQQPNVRWKWPRNRSAVLANFVGVENRNIKRHINKLRRLNLVSDKWQVNTWAIDPDRYRSPAQVEPAEPYVPQPETGDRRIDDLLNYLVLHLTSNGHDHNDAIELIETLIKSGHLNEIKTPYSGSKESRMRSGEQGLLISPPSLRRSWMSFRRSRTQPRLQPLQYSR